MGVLDDIFQSFSQLTHWPLLDLAHIKGMIFKLIVQISNWDTYCEIIVNTTEPHWW